MPGKPRKPIAGLLNIREIQSKAKERHIRLTPTNLTYHIRKGNLKPDAYTPHPKKPSPLFFRHRLDELMTYAANRKVPGFFTLTDLFAHAKRRGTRVNPNKLKQQIRSGQIMPDAYTNNRYKPNPLFLAQRIDEILEKAPRQKPLPRKGQYTLYQTFQLAHKINPQMYQPRFYRYIKKKMAQANPAFAGTHSKGTKEAHITVLPIAAVREALLFALETRPFPPSAEHPFPSETLEILRGQILETKPRAHEPIPFHELESRYSKRQVKTRLKMEQEIGHTEITPYRAQGLLGITPKKMNQLIETQTLTLSETHKVSIQEILRLINGENHKNGKTV